MPAEAWAPASSQVFAAVLGCGKAGGSREEMQPPACSSQLHLLVLGQREKAFPAGQEQSCCAGTQVALLRSLAVKGAALHWHLCISHPHPSTALSRAVWMDLWHAWRFSVPGSVSLGAAPVCVPIFTCLSASSPSPSIAPCRGSHFPSHLSHLLTLIYF